MKIQTYYWHSRVISRAEMMVRKLFKRRPSRHFTFGNAGDIAVKYILENNYGCKTANITSGGRRLLLIGSILKTAQSGDVVCGVGLKRPGSAPNPENIQVKILGLRGPLTYDEMKRKGHDLTGLKFLCDPGILISNLINEENCSFVADKISFIPHYKERFEQLKKMPKGFSFIDIDSHPIEVAKAILGSKIVYSSSLHGIIFSHALGRPCVFVNPQSDESLFKFEDYYESMDLRMPKPLTCIGDHDFLKDSDTPPSIDVNNKIQLPKIEKLKEFDVATKEFDS